MKTKENVQGGNGNMHSKTGNSSLPGGDVNDTGVKNGIGIPDAPGNKSNTAKQDGNNNRNRPFSNERPIF